LVEAPSGLSALSSPGSALHRPRSGEPVNHGVTPKDLRHTAASNLIASGADIVTVAFHTGHSVQVLMSTYAHEVEEALRRAAERTDEIIRAELPTRGPAEGP
jgi:integrase